MDAATPLLAGRPASPGRKPLSEELKKLMEIVGPAILQRLAIFSMNGVALAFAGHLGDRELAVFAIASTVISGFHFGLLLGMASALETLCGQAYGAKRYDMLGVYLQRSWLVELVFAAALTPTYFFTEQLMLAAGQDAELSRFAGEVSVWLIPQHFAMAMQFPMVRFLQCQRKNWVTALSAVAGLAFQIAVTWVFVAVMGLGVAGAALGIGLAWWLLVIGQVGFVVGGGCPETWTGLSAAAFADLWDFIKLSSSSGVMLCLELWYYKVLVFATGYLKNAEIAISALSICMTINTWEMMLPLSFFAGVSVRVANELGAGNGSGARFSAWVATTASLLIGVIAASLMLVFDRGISLIFTASEAVLSSIHSLAGLLSITILLNSVQPVLSGVAVGSGWQALVAYVNLTSYYVIGVPIGIYLGWAMQFGVSGIWAGMILGTMVQTVTVAYITLRRDWDKDAQVSSARMHNLGEAK